MIKFNFANGETQTEVKTKCHKIWGKVLKSKLIFGRTKNASVEKIARFRSRFLADNDFTAWIFGSQWLLGSGLGSYSLMEKIILSFCLLQQIQKCWHKAEANFVHANELILIRAIKCGLLNSGTFGWITFSETFKLWLEKVLSWEHAAGLRDGSTTRINWAAPVNCCQSQSVCQNFCSVPRVSRKQQHEKEGKKC